MLEDSLRDIHALLTKAVNIYNTYRPHKNLDNLTPMAYLNFNHTVRESKTIQDMQDREHFIKAIGNYIGDILKKTWSQESLVKKVTNQIHLNIKKYQPGV